MKDKLFNSLANNLFSPMKTLGKGLIILLGIGIIFFIVAFFPSLAIILCLVGFAYLLGFLYENMK